MALQILPGEDKAPIPYDRINAEDMRLIGACAQRAFDWMWDFKRRSMRDDLIDPDKMLIAMDISLAHLHKNLKLYQWLLSSDFDFVADLVAITKHVDRACGTFPAGVRLAFEGSGDSLIKPH